MTKNPVTICAFASVRYWKDPAALQRAFHAMTAEMAEISPAVALITEESQLAALPPGAILVAVPMSGAVQQWVLAAAEKFDTLCIYPGYVQGNFNEEISEQMLILNAAPAVMDIYAVAKRTHPRALLCRTRQALDKALCAARGLHKLQKSKLLLIGETEPWVISAARDLSVYKNRLGISFERVPQDRLIAYYEQTTAQEAQDMYALWKSGASAVAEPSDEDLQNGARLCIALQRLVEDCNAQGVAIACFALLQRIGATACLAVSYLNDHTPYIAACEGDTDCAATMLAMKTFATGGLWMANPNLQADKTVNFVHCTAPASVHGTACPYVLRNHHESGIGVSPQVRFPDDLPLTACRISDDASKITIMRGKGSVGAAQPSCRTQYRVAFEDFDGYIRHALGCHQVFAFGDIAEEMGMLATMLGIEILTQ